MSKAELSEEELNHQLKKLSLKFEWQEKHEALSTTDKLELLLTTSTSDLSDLELTVRKELISFYLKMLDLEENNIDITEGLPE